MAAFFEATSNLQVTVWDAQLLGKFIIILQDNVKIMLSSPSDLFSTPRVQLIATALVSGATVASLILGYQALEREERLSELKSSIPSLSEESNKGGKVMKPNWSSLHKG